MESGRDLRSQLTLQADRVGHGAIVASAQRCRSLRASINCTLTRTAVAFAAHASFENIRHSQGATDLAHIGSARFLIRHHARAASDFQIMYLSETRQEVILNPAAKEPFSLSSLRFSKGSTAMLFSGVELV